MSFNPPRPPLGRPGTSSSPAPGYNSVNNTSNSYNTASGYSNSYNNYSNSSSSNSGFNNSRNASPAHNRNYTTSGYNAGYNSGYAQGSGSGYAPGSGSPYSQSRSNSRPRFSQSGSRSNSQSAFDYPPKDVSLTRDWVQLPGLPYDALCNSSLSPLNADSPAAAAALTRAAIAATTVPVAARAPVAVFANGHTPALAPRGGSKSSGWKSNSSARNAAFPSLPGSNAASAPTATAAAAAMEDGGARSVDASSVASNATAAAAAPAFTAMSYNLLAQTHVTPADYPSSSDWDLAPQRRLPQTAAAILAHRPALCLVQEMESGASHYLPLLDAHGYGCVAKLRRLIDKQEYLTQQNDPVMPLVSSNTDASANTFSNTCGGNMSDSEPETATASAPAPPASQLLLAECDEEAVGVFYDRARFAPVAACVVEYSSHPSAGARDRTQGGVVLLLKDLSTTTETESSGIAQRAADDEGTRYVCVVTTHILYNPRRGDVKLAQTHLLLSAAAAWLRLLATGRRSPGVSLRHAGPPAATAALPYDRVSTTMLSEGQTRMLAAAVAGAAGAVAGGVAAGGGTPGMPVHVHTHWGVMATCPSVPNTRASYGGGLSGDARASAGATAGVAPSDLPLSLHVAHVRRSDDALTSVNNNNSNNNINDNDSDTVATAVPPCVALGLPADFLSRTAFLLGGDFNSTPDSAIVRFVSLGALRVDSSFSPELDPPAFNPAPPKPVKHRKPRNKDVAAAGAGAGAGAGDAETGAGDGAHGADRATTASGDPAPAPVSANSSGAGAAVSAEAAAEAAAEAQLRALLVPLTVPALGAAAGFAALPAPTSAFADGSETAPRESPYDNNANGGGGGAGGSPPQSPYSGSRSRRAAEAEALRALHTQVPAIPATAANLGDAHAHCHANVTAATDAHAVADDKEEYPLCAHSSLLMASAAAAVAATCPALSREAAASTAAAAAAVVASGGTHAWPPSTWPAKETPTIRAEVALRVTQNASTKPSYSTLPPASSSSSSSSSSSRVGATGASAFVPGFSPPCVVAAAAAALRVARPAPPLQPEAVALDPAAATGDRERDRVLLKQAQEANKKALAALVGPDKGMAELVPLCRDDAVTAVKTAVVVQKMASSTVTLLSDAPAIAYGTGSGEGVKEGEGAAVWDKIDAIINKSAVAAGSDAIVAPRDAGDVSVPKTLLKLFPRSIHHHFAPLSSPYQHPALPPALRLTTVTERGRNTVDHIFYSHLALGDVLGTSTVSTTGLGASSEGPAGSLMLSDCESKLASAAAEKPDAGANAAGYDTVSAALARSQSSRLSRFTQCAPLLTCTGVLELPNDRDVLKKSIFTPNAHEGSDHLPIMAEFKWLR